MNKNDHDRFLIEQEKLKGICTENEKIIKDSLKELYYYMWDYDSKHYNRWTKFIKNLFGRQYVFSKHRRATI